MLKTRQQGQLLQADAFDHLRGLNLIDSPFKLTDEHSISGYNADYDVMGGFKKRSGHTQLNASPDAQATAMGMFMHATSFNTKTILRAAGINLQTVNTSNGATTAVYTDASTSTSAVFTTTQPVVFSQFNTSSANIAWLAGGGQPNTQLGGYTGSQYTANGAVAPSAGTIGLTATGSDGTLPAGNYYYAVAFKKASTGAISNAAIDTMVTVASTNHVLITFSTVTNPDSTIYNKVVIYRSPKTPTGVSGFTVGDIVATLNYSTGFFSDTGTNQTDADLVPRANSTSLDDSTLPSGTYNTVTTWKRRLVTANGSTLYFSDINKPEAWPTTNTITVPSGGNITALAVINFTTPVSAKIDEMLCIFKERELWVITGNNFTTLTDSNGAVTQQSDITLLFVDYVGCVAQPLLVVANGFLYWIDYRGIYVWDGSYKPIYISRPLEPDFDPANGDIDLTQLTSGLGVFSRRKNQVIWYLSSKVLGTQLLAIKLDLRLTLPNMASGLNGRIFDGVFLKDKHTYNIYGVYSSIISSAEVIYASGNDGRIWKLYDNLNSDNGQAIQFTYKTRPEDFSLVATTKRFHKIIVWCRDSTVGNLTLNYWVDYRVVPDQENTVYSPISGRVTIAYWDQASWDGAYWDTIYSTYTPVVFNLNGVEGDALTLEFQQNDVNTPMTVAGYSIIYSIAGLRH